jgi:hypothetical protein
MCEIKPLQPKDAALFKTSLQKEDYQSQSAVGNARKIN